MEGEVHETPGNSGVRNALNRHRWATVFAAFAFLIIPLPFLLSAYSQSRPRTISQTVTPNGIAKPDEVVKVDVDLVTVDALVLQKKTARVVGDLQKADFTISEDGVTQMVTHFSQDSLPISMLLLVDRGACLDPFGTEVREAARHAIARLKPSDEVALMSYHDEVELLQEFTRDRAVISQSWIACRLIRARSTLLEQSIRLRRPITFRRPAIPSAAASSW